MTRRIKSVEFMKRVRDNVGMVDVSQKDVTVRHAIAEARVAMNRRAWEVLLTTGSPKGDIVQTARVAGVMAAKQTSAAIPLCHPLGLDKVSVSIKMNSRMRRVEILTEVKSTGRTGVEMEALYAASVAALTVYDMMKSVDRGMTIETIRLLSKSGGKSGVYDRAMGDMS